MPRYTIRGIGVDFPYNAYDCQLVYMEKVIQSLQEKCNALLESPTGTGKTLCLLCATLAWRKSLGDFSSGQSVSNSQNIEGDLNVSSSQSTSPKHPTIVYTTRTHSQLRQVIQELKKTSYSLLVSVYTYGARNVLLAYPTGYVKENRHLGDEPIDIEDLVKIGKSFGPCPYYLSRELHKAVDIMFAPYNYLIDRGYRKSLVLEWKNSVLIFDEAHNLESICADAASFDLTSWLLTACISEAKNCIDLSIKRRDESNDKSGNPDNFAILRALLLKLEKGISDIPIHSKELGFTKPGPYIYELLAELNITHESASKLKDIIEEAAILLEEDKQQKIQNTGCRLENITDILDIVFREKDNAHAKFYQVHVQENEASAVDGLKVHFVNAWHMTCLSSNSVGQAQTGVSEAIGKASRTLSWWCFNPGIALEAFPKKEVGSIILTSGTLSPFDSFAQELKLDFPIRLENPHVISSNQIWAGVVSVGPSGCSFNSSYWNRESEAYKLDLGNAIVNFARIVPDGLLVFFPSYYFLDQCISCWKNQSLSSSMTIWERICKHKKPVIEPRQSSLFPSSIEDYMFKLEDTSSSGAVFFAVCRGKVSEGLDFADHAGRAVIITGMPFASRNDPKIMTGEDWYTQQAMRAVNQAVGRVIRHRHDYGAIIFCDERYFLNWKYTIQFTVWNTKDPSAKFKHEGVDTTRLNDVSSAGSSTSKPEGRDCSGKSVSSLFSIKEASHSKSWKDVLPANSPSVTSFNSLSSTIKSSNNLSHREKKVILSDKKSSQYQSHEVIDLTDFSVMDEQPNKGLLVGCAAEKRKLSSTEHASAKFMRNSFGSSGASPSESNDLSFKICPVKSEASPSDIRVVQKDIVPSSSRPNNSHTTQKMGSESVKQNEKIIKCVPVHPGDEEAKGSDFLSQVREKLSAREYKEFVGFMKALKTKAMGITHVLQSIVRIFSGPDRLRLRTGLLLQRLVVVIVKILDPLAELETL
ncbi:regulator of telomere elongation helicase 1 isoform X1 [Cucumis melo var. makuwa]|uniref:Regulator of telomere elongation helicase 1 isoform X1 n=1 Tax=Cucumis melo var. makuwa TaxID=1194695 RepID=A0A5D3C0Z7_CUCMM|nr:regulator of telomere elongation helicase 1 isoform X1 [Cucumis melo var. makuwa]